MFDRPCYFTGKAPRFSSGKTTWLADSSHVRAENPRESAQICGAAAIAPVAPAFGGVPVQGGDVTRTTRSTMMTSNRPLEDWGKLLGDVPSTTAILDRFLHHAELVRMTGQSAYDIVPAPGPEQVEDSKPANAPPRLGGEAAKFKTSQRAHRLGGERAGFKTSQCAPRLDVPKDEEA